MKRTTTLHLADDIEDASTVNKFLTSTQLTDLTDAGDSTLHYHASDRLASNVLITDSGGYYTGTTVEAALQESATRSIAEAGAFDIFRCDSPGGISMFSGTISGTPSGTSVVYNVVAGQEAALVPNNTSQLAKMRLYNTTRGNYAHISNCNTGTNTITLVSNAPANWANGDAITIASQTTSGGTLSWIDLEFLSGSLVGKTSVFMKMQCASATVADTMRIHPFTASFSTSKYDTCSVLVSSQTTHTFALVSVITNVFSVSWTGTPTTLTIREAGYLG